MRPLIRIALFSTSLFSGMAAAAPGYFWEFGMEMEGMPFAMPKQKICAPKGGNEPPVMRADDECKILEKKVTGNRFKWKAQCKDGLMVGDITSTPTSYSGSMQMTESSGQTMTMKMSGKRLGECDYQDRSGEIKALQAQADNLLAGSCQEALSTMQGEMMGRQCPKETPKYCKQINTLEGYKAASHIPADMNGIPDEEMAKIIAERTQNIAKPCKLDSAKLYAAQCKRAVAESNFDFVAQLCLTDRAKLCKKALGANKLGYISASCPAEKEALIAANCEGRKYSSDIEPRFRDFCSSVGMLEVAGNNDASSSSSSNLNFPQHATGDSAPVSATDAVTNAVKDAIIDKGLNKLRGMFGF